MCLSIIYLYVCKYAFCSAAVACDVIVFILSVMISMYEKQMDVMNVQKLEYEQQIDKTQMEYNNQIIAMYKEKIDKEKLEHKREIAA